MSYLKINKNSLSLIKDELNNCYTSIENSVNNISNNLPIKRDLSILKKYKKSGTDYTKFGTEFNNSIDTINNNIVNSTVLHDLKSIINDIDSIIKAVDDFNNIKHTKAEKKITSLYEELSFLENIENTINNVEWEEEIIEEPVKEKKTRIIVKDFELPKIKTIDESKEDLFAKIKTMTDNDETKKRIIPQVKKEETKTEPTIEIKEEPIIAEERIEEIEEVAKENEKKGSINNDYFYLIIALIAGVLILIGLAANKIINTLWLIILIIMWLVILTIYSKSIEKGDKKE